MAYTLTFDARESNRILSALRERMNKARKSIEKFGDDFDPEKGGSIKKNFDEYQALIHKVQEVMQ